MIGPMRTSVDRQTPNTYATHTHIHKTDKKYTHGGKDGHTLTGTYGNAGKRAHVRTKTHTHTGREGEATKEKE